MGLIALDTTSTKITAICTEASPTVKFMAHYAEVSTTTYAEHVSPGALTGSGTEDDIVLAPAGGYTRKISNVQFTNSGASSVTITVYLRWGASASFIPWCPATVVPAGKTLRWDGQAWTTLATSGYGQYLESVAGASAALTNRQYSDGGCTPLTLQPGTWDLQSTSAINGSSNILAEVQIGVGTATGNSSAGFDQSRNMIYFTTAAATSVLFLPSPLWRVVISTSTTYYAKTYAAFTGGTAISQNSLFARRII